MNIILLGPPGAGKGTQAEVVSEKLKIPIISTGNIIREFIKNGSDIGKEAKSYIDKGQLLSDDIVINMVKERIGKRDCETGFILDGFPRTLAQVEALNKNNVEIDKVINIHASDNLIYKRMSGRRICEKCGSTYNIYTEMSPNKQDVCDRCNGNLIQRFDDKLETVKERLKIYYDQTEPLVNYYKKLNILSNIDGERPFEESSKNIIKEILK
ncbi:MAG: adenylate kinase [Candidatus Paraimprobicoccus trichonymphae]|uniref:Adenylate kinase n=1 Tax=Candidatus Paraimprobicoccus trichonymphae TaxID=3033793 RepID=A0AA48KXV0_9FIRM|nr:MAG: adenylate kinase [Candidatus Paraimprobicoccus trichonymphae]